jgi:hypothetical protein
MWGLLGIFHCFGSVRHFVQVLPFVIPSSSIPINGLLQYQTQKDCMLQHCRWLADLLISEGQQALIFHRFRTRHVCPRIGRSHPYSKLIILPVSRIRDSRIGDKLDSFFFFPVAPSGSMSHWKIRSQISQASPCFAGCDKRHTLRAIELQRNLISGVRLSYYHSYKGVSFFSWREPMTDT